jgi:hypothetical protein
MALVTVLAPYNNTELYEYIPLDIFSSRKKENQNNAKEPLSKTALLEHCAWELQ